jgi:hypothetical protein
VRTEQQVREAFAFIADRAPSPTSALSRLTLAPAPGSSRRRRTVVLLLATAVAVLALAVALPSILTNRTGVPADQRVPGNWNMIHRVDPPDGWTVTGIEVWPDHEITSLGSGRVTRSWPCHTTVYGVGALKRLPTERQPVTVQGRPGFYAPKTSDDGEVPAGVYWQYRPNGWAIAACEPASKSAARSIAERVVFTPVPMRLPFRLTSLPAGLEVGVLSTGSDSAGQHIGIDISGARAPDKLPPYVDFGPGRDTPDTTGVEEIVINGRTARLRSESQTLCFALADRSLCVGVGRDDRANPDQRLWEPGARELVIDLAGRLEIAADPADSTTWFDASDALNP